MIIKTLVENTSIFEDFKNEHGLCLYVETNKHKLLFDLGTSELFIENAKKMSVDISEVDLVIISHGHYDHGGGLKAFLKINSTAKIYLNEKAFNKHYSKRTGGEKAYIGLDEDLLPNDRFVFVQDHIIIDDELELFSNIQGNRFISSANQNLLMEFDSCLVQDDFTHEQNLIIKENDKTILIAGCAHNGIVNIIEHVNSTRETSLSHVIAGFHLYNRSANKYEDITLVRQLGECLKNTGLQCYTCHCTGIEAYKDLKDIMEEKIQYLGTGSTLII